VHSACFGIVNGRSTELSMPGSAATTYGTALTTRIAVAAIAPPPDVIPAAIPCLAWVFERRRQRAVDVWVPGDRDPVGQVSDSRRPVGRDIVREPGDVFDPDGSPAVDHSGRPHP
jgi:hypothetical protein